MLNWEVAVVYLKALIQNIPRNMPVRITEIRDMIVIQDVLKSDQNCRTCESPYLTEHSIEETVFCDQLLNYVTAINTTLGGRGRKKMLARFKLLPRNLPGRIFVSESRIPDNDKFHEQDGRPESNSGSSNYGLHSTMAVQ